MVPQPSTGCWMHPQQLALPDAKQQQTEAAAQKLVNDLEKALKVDYQSMNDLKKQASDIGMQVERLARKQGCPRPRWGAGESCSLVRVCWLRGVCALLYDIV